MSKESIEAKLVKQPEGHTVLYMEGEDYPLLGHPRGALLYGPLSPLKHLIKNRVFNDSWKLMEEGNDNDVIENIREALDEVFVLLEKNKLELIPYQFLIPPVKELYRAMTEVEKKMGGRVNGLKEVLCLILQEDDSYRFRAQWIAKFFGKEPTMKQVERALSMLEHAEVVGDMRERQRLLKRVILAALNDPRIQKCFSLLAKEMNWKKFKLTKGDKYFFRAKYFKVDFPEYEY